jgi:DNA-binding NarL/FixJ family response regulator
MRYRVLIVEDHPLLRQGLRTMVEASPDFCVIDEASRGREAIQKTVASQPDLVLLDLSLPDIGGLEVVAHVVRRFPDQKFIALSDSRGDIQASEAIRAGCQGYLLKDTSHEEVALAMKTVVLGRRFISQELAHALVGGLMNGSDAGPGRRTWNRLTARERSVFKLVAQGKTNRSMAEFLMLSPKTIEKHRASLMRKLELRSAVDLTLLAVDLGIVPRPDVSKEVRLRAVGDATSEYRPLIHAPQAA